MSRFMQKFQAEDVPEDMTVQAEVGADPDKYASVKCKVVYDEKLDKHGNKIKVYSHFEREPNVTLGGKMIYFPAGHSIHVESDIQAERVFKLNLKNPLIDMETGEEVPEDYTDVDYKRVVDRNTQHGRGKGRTSFRADMES